MTRNNLTEAEIHQIAHKAAKEAVRETFLIIGLDVDEATEVQADMRHLREWRRSIATVKKQSLITAVGIVTAGSGFSSKATNPPT
jgi:hypothetical protein